MFSGTPMDVVAGFPARCNRPLIGEADACFEAVLVIELTSLRVVAPLRLGCQASSASVWFVASSRSSNGFTLRCARILPFSLLFLSSVLHAF